MTHPTVIAIPTFRRPDLLRRLLQSLADQQPEILEASVIVGDNDSSPETERIVAEFQDRFPGGLSVIAVPEPGISAVRNALIREAYARVPEFGQIVMLDDDSFPEPGWLKELLEGAARWEADVAAGPIIGDLPAGSSRLARNSVFAGSPRQPTGPIEGLLGTNGVLVTRRILDQLTDPWFKLRFGLSGGEDYAFFRTLEALNPRVIWVDEARVCEPTPASRLSTSALLERAFSNGCARSVIDREFNGRLWVLRACIRRCARLALELSGGVAHADADRLCRCLIMFFHLVGQFAGVGGVLRKPYANAHRQRLESESTGGSLGQATDSS